MYKFSLSHGALAGSAVHPRGEKNLLSMNNWVQFSMIVRMADYVRPGRLWNPSEDSLDILILKPNSLPFCTVGALN
jgi:hypothetical protein